MDSVMEALQREPLCHLEVTFISCGRKRSVGLKIRFVHQARHVLADHTLRFTRASVLAVFHALAFKVAFDSGDCVPESL